jgi:hypothetical protein
LIGLLFETKLLLDGLKFAEKLTSYLNLFKLIFGVFSNNFCFVLMFSDILLFIFNELGLSDDENDFFLNY